MNIAAILEQQRQRNAPDLILNGYPLRASRGGITLYTRDNRVMRYLKWDMVPYALATLRAFIEGDREISWEMSRVIDNDLLEDLLGKDCEKQRVIFWKLVDLVKEHCPIDNVLVVLQFMCGKLDNALDRHDRVHMRPPDEVLSILKLAS
jgi:hypothetical protein